MVILRAVVQLLPLLSSACILVGLYTWGSDDISTYKITYQKPADSPGTLVVRTRTGDDHHLLITELRPGAGDQEAEEQEAGAQATGSTGSEAAERRVTSIHPHRWTTWNAAGTHLHYRTDFPTADRLRHPDDIRFIFKQWLSSQYFGSESHEELVIASHIGRQHQSSLFTNLTRYPDFRLGAMPSLNVLNRLASPSTPPENPEPELLLPIPPIAIPVPSRAGSGIMEVVPSILGPVVETSDNRAFTVYGYTVWEYTASSGIQGCGLFNRCWALLNGLARRFSGMGEDTLIEDTPGQLPVTAHFTYQPENDRVQLDRLEIGEYLTVTHTSSGETDSQDEFVRPLLSRWEKYLKQEGRLKFKGEKYEELYRESQALDCPPPAGDSKEEYDKWTAVMSILRPCSGGVTEYAHHTLQYDDPARYQRIEAYLQDISDRIQQRYQGLLPDTERGSEQSLTLTEVAQGAPTASNETGAAGTDGSTPSAFGSSSPAGEPSSRSTLLFTSFNSELKHDQPNQ